MLNHPSKRTAPWLARLLLVFLLVVGGSRLRAAPVPGAGTSRPAPGAKSPLLREASGLDYSTPAGFFTDAANLFLQTSGYDFTVTNIPVYPTNYYTPALHRLLQLAANIYDASTNRAFDDGTSPNGPFYPSVFRPTFYSDGSNVFINGYVEDVSTNGGLNAYDSIPLALPRDLAKVPTNATSQINIYGIPWVIGARTGFPNFNEISMQSVSQITRKVQIVKPSADAPPGTWQTNIQYTIGISNILGVEAWNSYTNNYPRAVDLIGVVDFSMYLTSELGVLAAISNSILPPGAVDWNFSIASNQWQGFIHSVNPNITALSFNIPLLTNVIFLPDMVYQTNYSPYLGLVTNFTVTGPGFLPHFVLTVTNSLRFIMLDHLTGRVIDYVHLNGMDYTRDLTGELPGPPSPPLLGADPGGVWETNIIGGRLVGVLNQIAVSLGMNPSGYPPVNWATDSLPGISRQDAIAAFQLFLFGESGNTTMQAPFSPTRRISVYHTWQANDPLVHYMLSDLTVLSPPSGVQTNYWLSNSNYPTLVNMASVNDRYFPWRNTGNPKGQFGDPTNYVNFTVKDPLVISSDNWNFSNTQPLNFSLLGNVHRGTPWQTLYLKSAPVISLGNWQMWTGNTNAQDAFLSEPTNDWKLAAALVPLLTPQDPHYLYGYNQSDPNVWAPAFQGMTVLTNTPGGLAPLVIDDTVDSNSIAQIVSGINAVRSFLPGQLYSGLDQLLAVPQLSVASPFLNPAGNGSFLTDAAYESIPAQLLPLLRPDSLGSVVSNGNPPQFQFTGFDGYAYNIQVSTDLLNWSSIATAYPANGIIFFTDTNQPPSAQRFYRTALAP